MKPTKKLGISVVMVMLLSSASVMAARVGFDDGVVGTAFGQPMGTPVFSHILSEDGVDVFITSLVSNGSSTYNTCKVEHSLAAPINFNHGNNNIMELNNVGLLFNFDGVGDSRFEFYHTGGTVNIEVNGLGDVIAGPDFPSLAGQLAPGITLSITGMEVPGGFKGTGTITGPVSSLRIGGAELYLDDVSGGSAAVTDNCSFQVNHESLTVGLAWGSSFGDAPGTVMFNEDTIPVSAEEFHFSNDSTTFGDCLVGITPLIEFGTDKVMRLQHISNLYDIQALGISTLGVSFEFLNDGRLENLQVNDGPLHMDLFENMPTEVAPGVTMVVESFLAGTGTYGLVTLTGNIETLLVGGRLFFLDNICVTEGTLSAAGDQMATVGLMVQRNYPNPFNPSTTVVFRTKRSETVELSVVDLAGRRVATLFTGIVQAGEHEVFWDGRNTKGQQAATGVYFVQLRSGQGVVSRKITMVK